MRRFALSVLGVALSTSSLAIVHTAAAEPAAPSSASPAAARTDARAAKAVKRLVTIKSSHATRRGGQRFVLRGKARTEKGVRRVVAIEAKAIGSWGAVKKVRTTRKGAWKVTLRAPNPTSKARLELRAVVEEVKSRKVRKAWRKEGRSTVIRVTFRNNPSIKAPTYTLPDPAACDSGTPGVMTKTAACVAAVEVQAMERMWRDIKRLESLEDDTDALLQLAVELKPGKTRAEEFHNLTLVAPYFSAAIRESEYLADKTSYDMVLFTVMWIGYGIQEHIEKVDPSVATATEWKPAWGDYFAVKDLATITMAGDTATLPERTFAADNSELTIGGTWTYAEGRWWSDSDPMKDLRTAPRRALPFS